MRTNQQALIALCDIEGYDDWIVLAEDSDSHIGVCNAICVNDDCEYTAEMEPDQSAGWCAECNTNTMKSVMVLGGII